MMIKTDEQSKINLPQLIQDLHQLNVDNGFWENGKVRNVSELCLLITSEVCEALEDLRTIQKENEPIKEGLDGYNRDKDSNLHFDKACYEKHVKSTYREEIADVFTRWADYMGFVGDYDVDRSYAIDNETIEYMYEVLEDINLSEHLQMLNVLTTKYVLTKNIDYFVCMYKMFIDMDKKFKLSLFEHVKLKYQYNKLRGYKHGRKF